MVANTDNSPHDGENRNSSDTGYNVECKLDTAEDQIWRRHGFETSTLEFLRQ